MTDTAMHARALRGSVAPRVALPVVRSDTPNASAGVALVRDPRTALHGQR